MIIWQGHGYLVAVIVFLSSLSMELLTRSSTGDEHYYQERSWPLTVALLFAAAAIAFTARLLKGAAAPATRTHTLFFIRMEYWPYILVALGLLRLVV